MKKCVSFFRMGFSTCVQYRASYVSGLATQLPWGLMECVAYIALHESNPGAFPMALPAVVTYIWFKEEYTRPGARAGGIMPPAAELDSGGAPGV